jgi:RNA polymerase sigma-70 factor (ECF subfamily)
MVDADEGDLIRRCQRGDDAAFRELVDRYKNLVFALMAGAIDDRARAEELSQEVFLRVHRGLPYFRGDARLSTWIFRIVGNLAADERGRATAGSVSLEAIDSGMAPAADASRLAADDSASGEIELRDRLAKAMRRLSPADRLLVTGHYLNGMRYEDLAALMNVTVGTVKTRLFRAKRALRLMLQTDLR